MTDGLKANNLMTAFGLILMSLLGFMGTHIWSKTEKTHDAVIAIETSMVRQSELAEVKAKMSVLEQKVTEQATKQTELQHAQDALSLEIRRIRQSAVTVKP